MPIAWHRVGQLKQRNNTAVAEDWPLGPESGFDEDARYRGGQSWQVAELADGKWVQVRDDNSGTFFHAALKSKIPLSLPITIGSTETLWKPVRVRIWANGLVVFDHRFRQDEVPFEQSIEVPLQVGENSVIIQVAAFGGPVRGNFKIDMAKIGQTVKALEAVRGGEAPSPDALHWFVKHADEYHPQFK